MPARPLIRSNPRWARGVAVATTAALAANGARLRGRASRLARVAPADVSSVDRADWRVIRVRGVEVGDETVVAIAAWAIEEGLDAVDLVPADLPTERALEVLRLVDPARYRSDPSLEGRTAGHAVVLREELAERLGLPSGAVTPATLVQIARQVKRAAPRTSDLAVVDGVRAVRECPVDRRSVQHAIWDRNAKVAIALPTIQLGSLGAGAALAPAAGVPALAAYLVQPLAVFAGQGNGLRPRDLAPHAARRWTDEVRRLRATAKVRTAAPGSAGPTGEVRPSARIDLRDGAGSGGWRSSWPAASTW